jgi:peptide/nickel transport system ATP-binding protein
MTILSVRDLAITYRTGGGDVPAVRGVDFDIDRGEVLGLAGESGCGKSTVVNAILRLLPQGTRVEGEIVLNDENVLEMRPGRLRAVRWTGASVVFQGAMHALNPVQRIGEQIAEAITIHGQASEREALIRVGGLLEQVGLPPRRIKDYPHELSGGQKQRVMIAMALACSPSLVIADEPTTALDVMVQAQVLRLLKSLQRELGLAMLFITHDLSVLVEVSDRLAIMYAGKIVEEGTAREVFTSPKHPYSEALAAAFPAIGDDRYRRHPSGLGGDPPDPQAIPSGCPFHPRCPYVFEACPTVVPTLYHAAPGRRAACLLVEGATVDVGDAKPGEEVR